MKRYFLRVKDITGQIHETDPFSEEFLEAKLVGKPFGTGAFNSVKPKSVDEGMELLAKMIIGDLPEDVSKMNVNSVTLMVNGRDRFFRPEHVVWAEVVVTYARATSL